MIRSIRISCQLATKAALSWLALGLLLSGCEAGELPVIVGTVVKVFDGDSLVVRSVEGEIEVRLADIDAPERWQPYAGNARRALTSLVHGHEVRLTVLDVDQYQRRVARMYRVSDGLDVNAELVRRGHAWVYHRYLRDPTLIDLERFARERRAGLWGLSEDQRVPPWQYRGQQRER